MKTMKRFMALAIALIMTFALAIPASAAASALTTTGTVTITGAAAGETYTFYRIFNIHKIDGSNYVFTATDSPNWNNTIASAVSDYVTVDTNGYVTKAADFTTNAKAQSFAKAIIDSGATLTAAATKNAVTSGVSIEVSNLQYGYYIMVSSRDTSAEAKYTVFTLASDSSVTIAEKNIELPYISKTVEGVEDITVGSETELNYVITVTAGAGTDKYTVTDVLPTGVTYGEDLTITGAGTNDYTLSVSGNTITVVLADEFRASLKDGDTVEITYSAKLNSDVSTKGANNDNIVTLDSDAEDKTDTATVRTYKLTVNKVDEKGAPLAGAKFKLKNSSDNYAVVSDGIITEWNSTGTELTSDASGKLEFVGLNIGAYTLVETDAPTGYSKASDTGIDINATDKDKDVSVVNLPLATLPETGGIGTTIFYTVGGVLVLGALVLLVTKKRVGQR